MATDTFLKLKGIDGEAQDKKHSGEIEVLSWSWGVVNSGSAATGSGAGSGKANFQDVSITKLADKASPELMIHCATGKHIPEAVLTCRKAGGEQLEYLKITLKDVMVTSFQTGGSGGGDEIPTENVGLNFAEVKYGYTPQKADGTGEAEVAQGYNLKENVKA